MAQLVFFFASHSAPGQAAPQPPLPLPLPPTAHASPTAAALPSPPQRRVPAAKSVWLNPNQPPSSHPLHHRHKSAAELQQRQHVDRTIDVPALVAALSAALAPHRPVSARLLGALLSRLPDPRVAPSVVTYNTILRVYGNAGRGGSPVRAHAQSTGWRWEQRQTQRGDVQHHDRHLRHSASRRWRTRRLGAWCRRCRPTASSPMPSLTPPSSPYG
jgi:hypothetical protein